VKFDDNVIVTVGAEDFLDGQLHDVGTITDVRWENQYQMIQNFALFHSVDTHPLSSHYPQRSKGLIHFQPTSD
jgi:hypothetical protein